MIDDFPFLFLFLVTVELLLEEMRDLKEELARVATLVSSPSILKPSDVRSVRNSSIDSTLMTSVNPWGDAEILYWLLVVASFVSVWSCLCNSWRLFSIMDAMHMPKLQVTLFVDVLLSQSLFFQFFSVYFHLW